MKSTGDLLARADALAVRYARCQDLLALAMRALARAQLESKADASFLLDAHLAR